MPEETSSFAIYQPILRRSPDAPGQLLDPASLAWRNGMLVRAPNWLGDTMMALPAVHKLQAFIPEPCGLFVLCPDALVPVWEAAPWVDHVVPMEGRRVGREVTKDLRALGPGVVVVLPNSFGSAWDVRGIGAAVRLGRAGRGRKALLTHRLPSLPRATGAADRHQLSHYLELAEAFGSVEWNAEFATLSVPDAGDIAERLGLMRQPGDRWLAVAPGAAYGLAKQWPCESFRQVVESWVSAGGRAVLVGTDREAELAARVAAGVESCVNLAAKTSLRELMAVLSSVDVMVANDSGPMHLGAALGTGGVAVFGSTDPVATGPLGAPWTLVREAIDCAPCLARTCRREDEPYACLTRVTADRVRQALDLDH